jgi:hypothetical protein
VDVESKRGEGDLEQVDVVLVARVCHLVRWQLCKPPLRLLPLPNLATVYSLLKILCDSQPCLITLWEHTQP